MGRIGVDCGPENILITAGSQQALDYLGKLFLSPGDTALVTWPTYLGALQAFNAYEPTYDRLEPMANRDAQDYADRAAEQGGAVKFAYMSPDFANPTGETMTHEQRERVLDLADALDIAVIEDGAYQALRYDGDAIPPMLALEIARKGDIDACRTLYCGSFSKTLSPGLRVGWVCASREIVSRLVILVQAGGCIRRLSTRRRSTWWPGPFSTNRSHRRAPSMRRGATGCWRRWRAKCPTVSNGRSRKAACSSGSPCLRGWTARHCSSGRWTAQAWLSFPEAPSSPMAPARTRSGFRFPAPRTR
jgi:hypothetical protein